MNHLIELFKGVMRALCFFGLYLWIWVSIETAGGQPAGDKTIYLWISGALLGLGAMYGWRNFDDS